MGTVENFRMYTYWGEGIELLSDAEAGRFVKALYAYVIDGQEYECDVPGRESPLIAMALHMIQSDLEEAVREEEMAKEKAELARKTRSEAARKAAEARWGRHSRQKACSDESSECGDMHEPYAGACDECEPQPGHADASDDRESRPEGCEQHADGCAQCAECEPHPEHADASDDCESQPGQADALDDREPQPDGCEQHAERCGECEPHDSHEGADDGAQRVPAKSTGMYISDVSHTYSDIYINNNNNNYNNNHKNNYKDGGGGCCGGGGDPPDHEEDERSVYPEDERTVVQKQRQEDISPIERLMGECGYDFAPRDKEIVLELLSGGETVEGILNAIMIAKESNALRWRYIKGILRNWKIGGSRYGIGEKQGNGWGTTGYASGSNGGRRFLGGETGCNGGGQSGQIKDACKGYVRPLCFG